MTIPVYQKRAVQLQEVIERVQVGNPALASPVILSVSPCRSGTTVLLRVFGAAGIEAHYQELKNILRWRMQGQSSSLQEDVSWRLPQWPDKPIYLKETIGPYTEIESCFNPLDVLLGAGYPPGKLHLLVLGRAPLSTWASWDAWWHGRTSTDKFVLAYQTTEQIRQQALHLKLPTTVFVYESIRDNNTELVIRRLFEQLNVPYTSAAVGGWKGLPPFGEPGSNIILPAEPPAFDVPHLHDHASQANRLAYTSREEDLINLNADDVAQIIGAGLWETYKIWRKTCEQDLGVQIEKSRDWE